MEKALYIATLNGLRYFNNKFQRIYWGTEFCQNLIPSLKNTQKIIDFSRRHRCAFTFVSPFVTESGLKKLMQIFSYFKRQKHACEIVVNDWGIMEHLHTKFHNYFDLALGRLLVRQQRVPLKKKIPRKQVYLSYRRNDRKKCKIVHLPAGPLYRKGIELSYVNSFFVQKTLSDLGVSRVELNNVAQGVNLDGIRLKKSIYTPFVQISTTRFCPMDSEFQKKYRIGVCKKECQSYYVMLYNELLSKPLFKKGNSIFYKNPFKTNNLIGGGVDRIVVEPEAPF